MTEKKSSRSLFEEVATPPAPASARTAPGEAEARKRRLRRGISLWLATLFVLVVSTLLMGGATRLTDSGLSITEWRPITGVMPPLSEASWQAEFNSYKAIPEFELVNSQMTLAEFRVIFWWEWGHRLLGRVIGLVWAAGFLWLVLRRRMPAGWTGRLLLLGALGGVQGGIGWWMVSSGLSGRMVDVAPERLAVHLGLAFTILGLIAWYVFLLRRDEVDLLQARRRTLAGAKRWATLLVSLAFLQILLGALVAGNDAGRGYIDWPLMGGQFLPSESFVERPLWRNLIANPALTQFNHRILGYLLVVLAVVAVIALRRLPVTAVRSSFRLAGLSILLQATLGVVTLVHVSPLSLALTHQLMATAVFCLILRARFLAAYPPEQSLRG